MKQKIIIYMILLMFISGSISITSIVGQPPKNQMIPGMLTDDAPYYSYLKDNTSKNSFDYSPVPITGAIGYWIEEIDEDMVLNYLQSLVDFGPRVSESTACDNAGTYIYEEFEDMGLSVQYQYWNSGSLSGKNVEATIPGEDPTSDKIFVVLGHYDSVSGSPGADDNGGGTTSALVAAEILSQYRFRHTIRFLTVDGEEQGLHGSSEYAEEALSNGDNIIAALNADMIGYAPDEGDDEFVKIYTDGGSEWLYHYINNISIYYDEEIGLETIDDGYISNSDHASFVNNGFDATCFHEYNFNDFYHSPNDIIGNMNMGYDANVTRLIVATLAELAEPILHEHDIIAKNLIVPSTIPHGQTQIVSATIMNGGNSSESNIFVDFIINDSVIDTTLISQLDKMESTQVNFSWNPSFGIYDVAIETQTIINEGDITNNRVNQTVSVIPSSVISVNPLSLVYMLPTEATAFDNIYISNLVSAEAILDYTITYAGDLGGSWISASPEMGNVPINNSDLVTITVDSTGLEEGIYYGYVIINSNDVDDPEITVSVEMTVVYGNDMKAVSVNSPTGAVPTGSYTVNATVQNLGYYPQTNVLVNCSIYEGGIGGTIIDEDFSTNPVDWTITNVVGTAWTWDSSDERMENSYSGSPSGYLDSPVLDCSGKTGISLSYWHYWKADYSSGNQDGYVYGSIDGGSTWPYLIDEFHHNDPAEETAVKYYDISSWADGQADVMVRFDITNDNDWYWRIDDFNVSAEITGEMVYFSEQLIDIGQYESQFVEFAPSWNPGMGIYGVQISTLLAGDEFAGNDVVAEVVSVEGPGLAFNPGSYISGPIVVNETDSTSFEIWNDGVGLLTYSLSESASPIDVSPLSGDSYGEHDTITVDINTTGLNPGVCYYYDIEISSDGGSGVFGVELCVVSDDTEFLDVNQSLYDRGFPVRHAADGDWAGATDFIPTLGMISSVDLWIRVFGTPEFDLTVELRSGSPDGVLIDSVVFTPGSVPSSWDWLHVDFTDTIVESGVDYFITVPPAPSGVTTSFGYEWGYDIGNPYSDGAFWFTRDGGGLWRDLPTMYEFAFRTYGYS